MTEILSPLPPYQPAVVVSPFGAWTGIGPLRPAAASREATSLPETPPYGLNLIPGAGLAISDETRDYLEGADEIIASRSPAADRLGEELDRRLAVKIDAVNRGVDTLPEDRPTVTGLLPKGNRLLGILALYGDYVRDRRPTELSQKTMEHLQAVRDRKPFYSQRWESRPHLSTVHPRLTQALFEEAARLDPILRYADLSLLDNLGQEHPVIARTPSEREQSGIVLLHPVATRADYTKFLADQVPGFYTQNLHDAATTIFTRSIAPNDPLHLTQAQHAREACMGLLMHYGRVSIRELSCYFVGDINDGRQAEDSLTTGRRLLPAQREDALLTRLAEPLRIEPRLMRNILNGDPSFVLRRLDCLVTELLPSDFQTAPNNAPSLPAHLQFDERFRSQIRRFALEHEHDSDRAFVDMLWEALKSAQQTQQRAITAP